MDLLPIYHRLPPWAREAAASLRGVRLRSWRYGPETDRQAAEAIARERWRPEQWAAWREKRLAGLLARAARDVPFYRGQWERRRAAGDTAPVEDLANWPVLDKDTVRDGPRDFLADGCRTGRMFCDHTSGSTGKPLVLWLDRAAVREWYSLCEARWRTWYGVSRHDRWGILGGQLVAPVGRRHPPFWVRNRGLNQIYLSSYHLAPDLVAFYLDAIERFGAVYLLGYTSALHALAEGMIAAGRCLPRVRVVVTNAEPVLPMQRQAIERAFRCPVRETYGMAETTVAAGECEAGSMHLWPEVGIVECLDNGRPVPAGSPGDLVCTGLINPNMPLIRYRVGDRAILAPPDHHCPCGRTLPVLLSLEGRSDDLLFTRDGRVVGRLDPVFKGDLPIREAQIRQEAPDRVRVLYVPADGFDSAAERSIVSRLKERMGEIDVVLERVAAIPRTAAGKFRAVVCDLDAETQRRLRGGGGPGA